MSKIKNAVKKFIYKPDPSDTGVVIDLTEELAPTPGEWPSTLEQIRDRFGTLNAAEALIVKAVIEGKSVRDLGSLLSIYVNGKSFYVAKDDGELSTLGTSELGFARREIVRWLEDGPGVVDAAKAAKAEALRAMQEYLQAPIKVK